MTLVLELPPQIESQVREVAQAEGVEVSALMSEAAEAYLRRYDPARPVTETDLLARINQTGLPEAFWERYRTLAAKRRAETLTRKEQQELIDLSDQMEARRVERLRHLVTLAEMRQTSVDAMIDELGLRSEPEN